MKRKKILLPSVVVSVVGIFALISSFIVYAKDIDYATQIQPIFDNNCNKGCHDGTNAFIPGLKLISYEDVMKGSNNGPVVKAGNAKGSLLVWKLEGVKDNGEKVAGKQMPAGKAPLDAATIQLVKDWIDEGALKVPATQTSAQPSTWGQIKSQLK